MSGPLRWIASRTSYVTFDTNRDNPMPFIEGVVAKTGFIFVKLYRVFLAIEVRRPKKDILRLFQRKISLSLFKKS